MKPKAVQATMQVIEDVLAQRAAADVDEETLVLTEDAYAAGQALLEAMATFRRATYAAGIEIVGGGALDEDDDSRAARIAEMEARAQDRIKLQEARAAKRDMERKAREVEKQRALKVSVKASAQASAKTSAAKKAAKQPAKQSAEQSAKQSAVQTRTTGRALPLPKSKRLNTASAAEQRAEYALAGARAYLNRTAAQRGAQDEDVFDEDTDEEEIVEETPTDEEEIVEEEDVFDEDTDEDTDEDEDEDEDEAEDAPTDEDEEWDDDDDEDGFSAIEHVMSKR